MLALYFILTSWWTFCGEVRGHTVVARLAVGRPGLVRGGLFFLERWECLE